MSTKSLTSALTNMMLWGDFSDLKFVCQGQEFKVHKAIVCSQSPVINAAVQGGFEESRTDVVNMDKFHPNTVKQLVKFLYSGDYDDCEHEHEAPPAHASDEDDNSGYIQAGVSEENNSEPGSPSEPCPSMAVASLSHHVCVNSIGDYYGVGALVSLANTKIRGLLQGKGKDKIWVPMLPAVTGDAIESTGDDELLRILASATAENISTLVNTDEFENLEPVSAFSLEVFKCCDQRIRDLTEELKQSRLNSTVETRKFESQIKERDDKIFEVNKCLETLKGRESCRHCSSEFGCYISLRECILRCSKCGCRHYD